MHITVRASSECVTSGRQPCSCWVWRACRTSAATFGRVAFGSGDDPVEVFEPRDGNARVVAWADYRRCSGDGASACRVAGGKERPDRDSLVEAGDGHPFELFIHVCSSVMASSIRFARGPRRREPSDAKMARPRSRRPLQQGGAARGRGSCVDALCDVEECQERYVHRLNWGEPNSSINPRRRVREVFPSFFEMSGCSLDVCEGPERGSGGVWSGISSARISSASSCVRPRLPLYPAIVPGRRASDRSSRGANGLAPVGGPRRRVRAPR